MAEPNQSTGDEPSSSQSSSPSLNTSCKTNEEPTAIIILSNFGSLIALVTERLQWLYHQGQNYDDPTRRPYFRLWKETLDLWNNLVDWYKTVSIDYMNELTERDYILGHEKNLDIWEHIFESFEQIEEQLISFKQRFQEELQQLKGAA